VSTILRLEHTTRMAERGPGADTFGLGVYCPHWDIPVPNGCRRRWPRWQNDRILSSHAQELEPECSLADVNWEWYFGFSDMEQLRRWFPVSRCRRFAYASAGVVIREYAGPTVIAGDKQSVMNFCGAARTGTFHVYTGRALS
jgi:hypothetical protein